MPVTKQSDIKGAETLIFPRAVATAAIAARIRFDRL